MRVGERAAGGGVLRWRVGAHICAEGCGLQELGEGEEVALGHLLRHERVGDEEHVLRKERKLVGEDVVALLASQLQLDQPLALVADLAKVEAARVERSAHEELVSSLLWLGVATRVEALAHGAEGLGDLLLIARVIHDELLLRRRVLALSKHTQEASPEHKVIRSSWAMGPVGNDGGTLRLV